MPSDEIETLLRADFDELTARLDRDGFEQRLAARINAAERARMGVIGLASFVGAGLAAFQLSGLGKLAAPYVANEAVDIMSPAVLAQLTAAMIIATAVFITALILRQES